jgi:hypothetical protein
MTLSTQTPRVVITGNGTRGPYSLVDGTSQAIRFTSTSHVRLTRYNAATDDNNDGSVLVENTDYTIGGTQDARTFTLASSEDVLTSNQRIVAERVQSYSQDLSLTTGGSFNASAVQTRFDKVEEKLQELKASVSRAVLLQYADNTANVALPSPPTSATQFLARNTAGEIVHATAADLSVDVALGSGWETILGLPAAGTLDNLNGVRYVATYAALTALTTATGLADNAVYFTYGRAAEEDGGAGLWRYDSGSSATANGGTILAIDGGGAGRFFRLDAAILNPLWFSSELGAGLTSAASAMAATYGRIRVPPGSYTQSTQATFPRTKNFYTVEMEGCRINVTYTGGAGYKIGDGTALTQICVFKGYGTYIDQGNSVNQPLFEARGVRGLYIQGFRGANLYQILKWGDGADAQSCYQWWHTDCEWNMRSNTNGGHIHAVNGNGSAGGYYETDCAIEGDSERLVADQAFFYLDANQGPARFDHFARSGGSIWKYFDYGIYAENARIVNVDFAGSVRIDDCGQWAVRIKVTAAGSKGGIEGGCFKGIFGGGQEGGGIWLSNESGPAIAVIQNVTVHGMETANLVEAFFKATTTGTGTMKQLQVIDNHLSDMNTSSNNVDCIILDGDITETKIAGTTMDRKSGSTYTPRYLIYNNTASTKSVWITDDNTTIDANTGVVYDPNIGDLSIDRFCAINTDGTPRRSYPIRFVQTDFATSQTNVAMNVYDASGVAVAFARVLRRARIMGLSVDLNASVAAGSLTIGAATGASIDTNLDIVMTSGDGGIVEYAAGSAALAAGDKVYARYTSDGSLTANIDGSATLYIQEM